MINEQEYKKLIAEVAANIDEAEVEVGQSRVKSTRKGISKVDFKNIRPDSQTATDAMNIVSRISREVEDFPTRAVVGSKFVNDDAKQGEMIVFRIDFETNPSFVATVKTNPSDLGKGGGSVNIDDLPLDTYAVTIKRKGEEAVDKEMVMTQIKKLVPNFKFQKDITQRLATGDGTLTLKSTDPVKKSTEKEKKEKEKFLKKDLAYQSPRTRRGFSQEDPVTSFLGNPGSKTTTKVARSSQSPAIVRRVKEEEQSFGAITKRKSAPIVSAGFLGVEDSKNPTFDKGQRTFSKFQKLDTLDSLQQSTKDLISKFLRKLGSENIKEIDTDNSNNMKKEQKFKQKIAEVAARIAEGNYEKDDVTEAEAEIPAGVLTQYNSEVQDGATLAKVLIRIINQIIEKEPSLQDLDKRSGWAIIMPKLKDLADPKQKNPDAGKSSAPDTSELPALQEAFNRINRK